MGGAEQPAVSGSSRTHPYTNLWGDVHKPWKHKPSRLLTKHPWLPPACTERVDESTAYGVEAAVRHHPCQVKTAWQTSTSNKPPLRNTTTSQPGLMKHSDTVASDTGMHQSQSGRGGNLRPHTLQSVSHNTTTSKLQHIQTQPQLVQLAGRQQHVHDSKLPPTWHVRGLRTHNDLLNLLHANQIGNLLLVRCLCCWRHKTWDSHSQRTALERRRALCEMVTAILKYNSHNARYSRPPKRMQDT